MGRISEENYYHLCDLVCDLLGQKTKLKAKGKDLEVFAKKIIKYITDPNLSTQNDYEFAKAKFLFDSTPIKYDSIMPFMFKHYGQIDKQKISLQDYLELYKALEKWQN